MRDTSRNLRDSLRARPALSFGVLCGSALITVAVAGVALAILFDAAFDRCDRVHESPNTPLGWAIAGAAVATTLVLSAYLFAGRTRLLSLGVVIAQTVVLWWLVTPAGSC